MALPALALVSGIVQLAPALAKVFGAGSTSTAVAEKAAEIARIVTGTESNDKAIIALSANPELLVQFEKAVMEQQQELEGLYVKDKESARLRDVEFLKAGTRNYRADFLVGISVLVVFTILGVVILATDLNEYAKGALTTILGVFLNMLTNVFNFEFGTTRKSEDTQQQITSDYIKKP